MRKRIALAIALTAWLLSAAAQKQKPKKLPSDRTTDVKKIKLAGAELNYIDSGRGVPVVLIHGTLSDYRIWASQIRPLAARYRVIAYSRRYHQPNQWRGDGSDYSAALHAADLAAILQALRLGPAHVVGHSAGGAIALLLARDHPELVRSVVVMEPGLPGIIAGSEGESYRAPRQKVFDAAKAAFAAGDDERAVRTIADWALAPRAYNQLLPPMKTMFLENAKSLKAQLTSSAPPLSFGCEDARKLTAPVLLVEGDSSLPDFIAMSRALEACLPSAERVVIPHATHFMQVDNRAAFNRALLDFLGKH